MVALMDHYGNAAVAAQQKMAQDLGWPSICSPQSTLLVCASPTCEMVNVAKGTRLLVKASVADCHCME
jgi:hypothetical protein